MIRTWFVLCLVTLLAFASTASAVTTCSNHPAMALAKTLIQSSVSSSASSAIIVAKLIADFGTATPTSMSAADLGICSQYAGQLSCCSKSFVQILDKLPLLLISKLLKKPSIVNKIAYVTAKVINANNCQSSSTAPVTEESILNDATFLSLISLKTETEICKASYGKAIARRIRGTFCTICIGVDSYSSLIDGTGMLKVSQASIDSFVSETEAAITCVNNAISPNTVYNAVKSVVTKYATSTCTINASSMQTVISQIFTSKSLSNDGGSGTKLCNGKRIFSASANCESVLNGDTSITTAADSYVPVRRILDESIDHIYRLLAVETDDITVVATGGITTFVPSSSDSSITGAGTYSVDISPATSSDSVIIKFLTSTLLLVSLITL